LGNYLKGRDLLKRWNISNTELIRCIKKGLQPYWYDGRKAVDKKLLVKKIRVVEKESQRIRKENPHLQDMEIKKQASKLCQEKLPNLPWNIKDFYFTNLTLPEKSVTQMSHTDLDRLDELIKYVQQIFFFKKDDIYEFEKKHFPNQKKDRVKDNSASTKTLLKDGQPSPSGGVPNSTSKELDWSDIKIILTSYDQVRIKTPFEDRLYNYAELGFANKHNTERKKKVWLLLVAFAQNNGIISSEEIEEYSDTFPGTDKADETQVFMIRTKELNKLLKNYFGLEDSIYVGTYKKMFKDKKSLEKYYPKVITNSNFETSTQASERKDIIKRFLSRKGYVTKFKIMSTIDFQPHREPKSTSFESEVEHAKRLTNQR